MRYVDYGLLRLELNSNGSGFGLRGLLAAMLLWLGSAMTPGQAQTTPLLVTYGPEALTIEGDFNYRQVIILRLPASLTEPLYLQVFDADSGGEHDLLYATADTSVRYDLFAASVEELQPPRLTANGELPASLHGDTEDNSAPLAHRQIANDPSFDDRWQTLFSLNPHDGTKVGDDIFFKLTIRGIEGDDANLFDVALSQREQRLLPPLGAEIFSYAVTARSIDRKLMTEIRVGLPAAANEVTVHNFDAAGAEIKLATALRSQPVTASGQDQWRSSRISLNPSERGQTAALSFRGGNEMPNDATFYLSDEQEQLLPMQLPLRAWQPNRRPQPQFTTNALADCATVAFDAAGSSDPDGASDELSYHWSFGDGASDATSGSSAVHRYGKPGDYQATLEVSDGSGQIGNGASLTLPVLVKQPPRAVAGDDRVVAPGEAVEFDASASLAGDSPLKRYRWRFGDGGEDRSKGLTHVYQQAGRYRVTLWAEDNSKHPCGVASDELTVIVNAAPVAEGGIDQHVAVGQAVALNGGSSYDADGEIEAYDWDLGDGTKASGPRVQHVFAEPGSYQVTLQVRDDAAVDNSVATDTLQIRVNAPPVAAAGPDRQVAVGEVIEFDAGDSTDSDGLITSYGWQFGDGSDAAGERASYAYAEPGEYQVVLRVEDNSGTGAASAEDTVQVRVNAPPVAVAGDDLLVSASVVRFDGRRSHDPDGQIAEYRWDFGDGSSGNGSQPAHTYRSPGVYRVRLSVNDDSGMTNSSAIDEMRVVINALPIADAGGDQFGAPGELLTFDAGGSVDPDGDIGAYSWNFGDSTTATGMRVTKAYAKPGRYTVRLQVQDNTDHPSALSYGESQVVINAPPVAEAGPDLLIAPGTEVALSGGHSFDPDGEIITCRWDFDDGSESVIQPQVQRRYDRPGIYTVRMTVTDNSGLSNASSQDRLTVRVNHTPTAVPGPDLVTGNNTVSLDASNSAEADGDALSYSWDFGDGSPPAMGVKVEHTYADGGRYPVVLTVNDGTGLANASASAALTVTIDQPPVAVAGADQRVCGGDVVVFDGGASADPEQGVLKYQWNFGDNTTGSGENPVKVYDRGGVYPVTLQVQDDSGLSENKHLDRLTVTVQETPVAEAGPDIQVCANAEVRFDGSASSDFDGVVNRYSWDFGDGSTGGGEKPAHIYARAGTYRVSLNIEGDDGGQCDNGASDQLKVTVIEAPAPRFVAPKRAPVGDPVLFDASASSAGNGEITAWRWDFGDGASDSGQTLNHIFTEPGRYPVTLTLETSGSASGCERVSRQQVVVVNAAPVALAGDNELVGVNQEIVFDGTRSTDPDGAITEYRWDFGDGNTGSGVQVRHRYKNSGRYPVTLTVTDDTALANNSGTDAIEVVVNAAPQPIIDAPAFACAGEELQLSAARSTDTDGEVVSHRWNFGDSASGEGAQATHTYSAPGRYPVTLHVDDGSGVNNSHAQASVLLAVNRPPRAVAGPDLTVCPGTEVSFDGSRSIDWDGQPLEYRWDFGNGVTTTGATPRQVFDEPGRYAVKLRVSDMSGAACASAEDSLTVTVNGAPTAHIDSEREAFTGGAHDALLFNATGSRDPEGKALSYLWDFGDGTTELGGIVPHSYAKPGQYLVRLQVDDGSGLPCGQATEAFTLVVKDRS